ncbi:PREDICTED: clathrin light chain 2-like [Ipomoea nil]|uniref:clathrin light chain 2-like n=1 Tax=Ipomoea nil TaxID=35883 RepID=UPI000901458C|nr:PREDICTED: clathrin light chain 2-like [Ipomoea nil]
MIISSSSDSPAVPVSGSDDDDGGFVGYDPLLSANLFAQSESAKDSVADDDSSFFTSVPVQYIPPISVAGSIADPVGVSVFSLGANERSFGDEFVASSGAILPPATEMSEGGFLLREWTRQNAIRLELKDKSEKELLSQIIDEANEYKDEFYKKRLVSLESNKGVFREKEKLFLSSHEKLYAEADKHYWETIAKLVVNEAPTIVKKNTKDPQRKHSIGVIQGPKPGKPADLSRMQEILLKLKANTPPHLDLSPPPT